MTALEYFEGDELPASVWTEKYALRDKDDNLIEDNPDQMHRRIAKEFARIEAKKFKNPYTEDFIYELLKDFGILIPQGSGMAGIGSDKYVSLSNCFVVQPPEDSYGGICYTDEQMVQICKRRGGVGTDISKIRPDTVPTSNSSRRATGIIPFMERYSNSIREVGQAGRRGALMLTLSVHHPQVLDFARVKLDASKVTGANISIRLSNAFLEAVAANKDYEQKWPVDSDTPTISKWVNARDVWMEIVKCAHARAEPGILFWDTIIKECPADYYSDLGFGTVSTNPCISGNSLLLTPNGLKELNSLNEGSTIWSEDGWVKIKRKWSTGIKDIYRYRTTAGVVYATENHRIVQNGEKVELIDAEAVDVLKGPPVITVNINHQAVADGLYFGDGSSSYKFKPVVYIGQDDQCYFESEIKGYIGKKHSLSCDYTYEINSTLTSNDLSLSHEKRVPSKYLKGTFSEVASFLRGLYSANGSVVSDRVTLKTTSVGLVEDVQIMLSSLGISSYYTTNKKKAVTFANGEYECRESYDINISRDRAKFYTTIGFIHPYKTTKLYNAITSKRGVSNKKQIHDIVSIDYHSTEEVFDIEVDGIHHTYWYGGHNISNCSELPMCILDSCRLLLINLFSCVVNPYKNSSKYNFKKLYEYAYYAQRLMDDLVDLELECINRIIKKIKADPEPSFVKDREIELWTQVKWKAENGRRTGTGPTALGDVIAALGMKYSSNKCIAFVDEVYKTIKLGAYRASVDMAKELGHFPIWDKTKEKDCPFLLRMKTEDPQLYKDMQKYGRRNIAALTTAPAGSTSILAGPRPYFGKTSGIEPIFTDVPYTRRKKINHAEKHAKVDFVDGQGDKWTEYEVYHSMIRMWKDVTGNTDLSKSPYAGSCAEQLDWRKRVKLQAVANKHVDHAISSTLNLPEDVTVEQVAEIYETAWKEECKGITVYRKNCRTGVLVDKKTKPVDDDNIVKTKAPKRPKHLKADLHDTTIKGVPFTVLVGLHKNDPYEVFALPTASLSTPESGKLDKEKEYLISKESRGHYKLIATDVDVDLTESLTDEQAAIARLTSTSLRHGVDTTFVVHQLEKVKGPINGFAKAIARVLKKYIPDGTQVTGEKCTSCESTSLVRQEGCVTCKSCGWSKCS